MAQGANAVRPRDFRSSTGMKCIRFFPSPGFAAGAPGATGSPAAGRETFQTIAIFPLELNCVSN
jgi:hypothetical protein